MESYFLGLDQDVANETPQVQNLKKCSLFSLRKGALGALHASP